MALQVEKGTFTKTTSTSTPVSQTVNLVDSTLTPKAIILWTAGHTVNDTFTDDSRFVIGWSDTSTHACQSFRHDESAETEAYVIRNNAIISIFSLVTASEVSVANISSVAAGSFTLNWSTQTDTSALVIHYAVLGGSDLLNASVFNTTIGSIATGNRTFNKGSGTTFTPDFALIMNTQTNYLTANSVSSNFDNSMISVGCTDGTRQWVVSGRDESASTSDCDMYINDAICMNSHDAADGNINFQASFVSFNSAAGGGMTVNITDGAGNTSQLTSFLFLETSSNATFECGTFQQRSGTGTQDVSFVNTDLDPQLVFIGGINTASNATVTPHMYLGFGAADGTREGCSYFGNTNGLGTHAAVRVDSASKVYRMATPAATAASSTINAECNMNDMATAGKFQLNWTTADTTLRRMAFWTVGTVAATEPVSETSIHKYDITGNVAQTNIHKYHLFKDITQTSIQKYHLLNFITAATSIHKYNLLQNILQSSIQKYNLFANIVQSSIHKYNLIANVLRDSIHKYDMLNFVPPATSVHKYDIRANILAASIHKYNLFKDILQTSIHKYNLIAFIAAANIHKYNLAAYIAQQSIHKYNMLAYILQNSIHKYDILALAQVLATSIHKYHLFNTIAATSLHKYSLLQNIVQSSIHKYNLLNTIAQSSIHKYDILNNVLQSSIHKYSLLQNIIQSTLHKYNLIQDVIQASVHKYNLIQNVIQTSIHKYDIQVLGAVVNALIAKYNISAFIAQSNIHKYSLLNNIAQTSIHKYNLLVNLIANSTQKYDVLQSILQTSLHKYALLQNVVLSSIHKYDIIAEALTVLANSIHKYNLLNTIAQTSKHKYDLLNTVARTSIHKYNILQQILRTSIHKYGMGGIVSAQSKHLYNLIRELLGSSVAGGVAKKPTLKQIKYPVYRIEELRKLELRRRLKGTESVVIPAFSENIHRTLAPFVITNPITNRVTVRFALRKEEPISFNAKQPIPIQIQGKTAKKEANKAKSAHVMQQKTIERYGKRLNKLSKLLNLFLLAEEYDKLKEE